MEKEAQENAANDQKMLIELMQYEDGGIMANVIPFPSKLDAILNPIKQEPDYILSLTPENLEKGEFSGIFITER